MAYTTKKKSETDDSLEKVLKDFNASWQYAESSWHKRWQDNQFLYNNQRVNIGYEGITDTFVPMVFSTVETLTSAIFGTKPKFSFAPPQNKPDQKTDILNALLDFYWEKDQWSLKVINTGRNMFKLGTAVDYFCWDKDHPKLINVPIRDFFIDPTASSLETARYMGRRYLTTKEQLESYEIVDFEKSTEEETVMKKKYKNLDKLHAYKSGDNTDKQEKDMWYGSTVSDPENNQIECIEYWTEDRIITIANRCAVIEDEENYYKAKARAMGEEFPQGLMPFADARDYVDESLFYAKGEVDIIGGQQELLNDLTNQNVDSITYTLNQMYTLPSKYGSLINEIENLPGAVYPIDPGDLAPIQQRPIPPDGFNERQNIKNEMRETTASNEVVKGVGAQQGGDPTATEINAQIAGAGQRINLKVTQVENGYFQRVARIVFAMVKLYVTEPMMVRIIGKDGAKWELFDPSEFQDDYEPRVQLDLTMQNKKQEQANQAKELLGAFLGDPDVNQAELKKLVLQRSFDLDPDEVEVLMQPAQMMGDPAMAMPGMMSPEIGGMPQDMGEMSPEAMPDMPMAEMPMEAPVDSLAGLVDQDQSGLPELALNAETGQLVNPATGEPVAEILA